MPVNFNNDSMTNSYDTYINNVKIDYDKILNSLSVATATGTALNTTTISANEITISTYNSEIAELKTRMAMLMEIVEKLVEDNGALTEKIEVLSAIVSTTQTEGNIKAEDWSKAFGAIMNNAGWNY